MSREQTILLCRALGKDDKRVQEGQGTLAGTWSVVLKFKLTLFLLRYLRERSPSNTMDGSDETLNPSSCLTISYVFGLLINN